MDVWFSDVVLIPTLRCNCMCYHCCRSATPNGAIMSEKTAIEVSEFLRQVGSCDYLVISGGEPLMMSYRLWQNVALAVSTLEVNSVWVITNGEFLKSHDYRNRALYGLGLVVQTVQARELGVELSLDFYHMVPGMSSSEISRLWEQFWACWMEDYIYPSSANSPRWALTDVSLSVSVRRGINEEYIVPRGRAAGWSQCKTVDCLGDNSLTISPKGEIFACPENGGVIGNVSEDVRVIGKRLSVLREKLQERFGVQDREVLRASACRACDELALQTRAEVTVA